jgi:hypothetical protein
VSFAQVNAQFLDIDARKTTTDVVQLPPRCVPHQPFELQKEGDQVKPAVKLPPPISWPGGEPLWEAESITGHVKSSTGLVQHYHILVE